MMTMMQTQPRPQQSSRADLIESKIDRSMVSTIGVSPQRGMAVDSMGQAMEVAKLMSVSGSAVPRHLRGNPGACLAVAIQGWEWGINPFAIANKSYEVNDRLAYESALYHAVLTRRAPIKGRIKIEYAGKDVTRTCRVWAELNEGGTVDYTSPEFGKIKPKNSPLWVNDPDQQLFYFSVRSFARRHFPDVMMGIATADELMDAEVVRAPEPAQSRTKALLARITDKPVSEGQTFEPDPQAEQHVAAQAAATGCDVETGEVIDATSTQAELDTSGADAEPPADETPSRATGDRFPTRQAASQSGPAAGPDVSTWAATTNALVEAAIDAGLVERELQTRVNLWLVANGARGKEDRKTTAEQRSELVEAVRDGRLGPDGKIAAKG